MDQGTQQLQYLKFPSKQWYQARLPLPAELRMALVVSCAVGFQQENLVQKM